MRGVKVAALRKTISCGLLRAGCFQKDEMAGTERVTILGDGGWGTALALVNARRGNEILLWSAFGNSGDLV